MAVSVPESGLQDCTSSGKRHLKGIWSSLCHASEGTPAGSPALALTLGPQFSSRLSDTLALSRLLSSSSPSRSDQTDRGTCAGHTGTHAHTNTQPSAEVREEEEAQEPEPDSAGRAESGSSCGSARCCCPGQALPRAPPAGHRSCRAPPPPPRPIPSASRLRDLPSPQTRLPPSGEASCSGRSPNSRQPTCHSRGHEPWALCLLAAEHPEPPNDLHLLPGPGPTSFLP